MNTIKNREKVPYIPIDRAFALSTNTEIPETTVGTVLFADVSGFTPLGHALRQNYGDRRGAELLIVHLNDVFNALITEVHSSGGCVLGFSGDAITCLFDANRLQGREEAAHCAITCAVNMLKTITYIKEISLPDGTIITLGMKVALASGKARRFVVGNPDIQLMDVLAGNTMTRMATAEQLASKGEIVADAKTIELLGDAIQIREWREEDNTQFGVLAELLQPSEPHPWGTLNYDDLRDAVLSQWLLPRVNNHLDSGSGEFLTELRPAVALFMRFTGLDYDNDPEASHKLDLIIRWVQDILVRYDGNLLQLTVGDKGSYLYAVFGAPIAHEDDAYRAASAALELRQVPDNLGIAVQIGISQGVMRTGAYGGQYRRTYGVQGDQVNLAARLMSYTEPGTILVNKSIADSVDVSFLFEDYAQIKVKGMPDPISVAYLRERKHTLHNAINYSTPMIGREEEFSLLQQAVQPIFHGENAGMIYVFGEVGMGKSRLVTELRQTLVMDRQFSWWTAPTDELHARSLHPFARFLRDYFDQQPDQSLQDNVDRFNFIYDDLVVEIKDSMSTERSLRIELERTKSFLGGLLGLRFEDSLYEQVSAQLRLENTLQGIISLIRLESQQRPLILHIDDSHWLDADSQRLINELTRDAGRYPFAVILTSRYADDGHPLLVEVDADIQQTIINMRELTPNGIRLLAENIIGGVVGASLVAFLEVRTNGNPFFVEQLVLDLQERGLLETVDGEWCLTQNSELNVPDGINSILIARIDRLSADVKAVVQTASVIGSEFELPILSAMLQGMNTELLVSTAADAGVWGLIAELRYLFRHVLLRDAAYNMQVFSRVQQLHYLAAHAIEVVHHEKSDEVAAVVCEHLERADRRAEASEWYIRAAQHAQFTYHPAQAIEYYEKALALWDDDTIPVEADIGEEIRVYRGLGSMYSWQANFEKCSEAFELARTKAEAAGNIDEQALAWLGIAEAQRATDEIDSALESLSHTEKLAQEAEDHDTYARALRLKGWLLLDHGNIEQARQVAATALQLSEDTDTPTDLASSLNLIGVLDLLKGQFDTATNYFIHALEICEQVGHRLFAMSLINNLGSIALERGDNADAAVRYQDALNHAIELRHEAAQAAFRANLGGALARMGDGKAAVEILLPLVASSEGVTSANMYYNLAEAYLAMGKRNEALDAGKKALELAAQRGSPEDLAAAWRVLGRVAEQLSAPIELMNNGNAQQAVDCKACYERSIAIASEAQLEGEKARTLRDWARYELLNGDNETGKQLWQEARAIFQKMGATPEIDRMDAWSFV